MKTNFLKRAVSLVVSFVLLTTLLPVYSGAYTAPEFGDTYIRTSANEENYIEFTISGNSLTAEGVFDVEGLEGVMLNVGSQFKYDYISGGENFSVKCSLGKLSKPVQICFYANRDDGGYKSVLDRSICIEQTEDGYRFLHSKAEENNRTFSEAWLNPGDYLCADISESVAAMSDAIVGSENDDYKKVFLLHKWVADNIYYDHDKIAGKGSTFYGAEDVLENRRAVCDGYANLLISLIQAQGIPAMKVTTLARASGYGSFATVDDSYLKRGSNHAHVEAFAGGRWVAMDPTWDSMNVYRNGEFKTYLASAFIYFDPSVELLALDHMLLSRGDHYLYPDEGLVGNKNDSIEGAIPTVWAKAEVWESISLGLVPYELQGGYQYNITREEFCRTLVSMLRRSMGCADNDELLAAFGMRSQNGLFTDTDNADVCAASLLGVINGRGNGIFDPESSISRQEAATMLMRAAKLLGLSGSTEAEVFGDDGFIKPWAKEAVYFVQAIGVMNGVGGGNFDPAGSYTRQQAYLTILRLYNSAEVH